MYIAKRHKAPTRDYCILTEVNADTGNMLSVCFAF